ncbi:MAG TPA: SpoIIE family protein phosphatase [Bryobacteraceae bacterium]|nr:SpoIIE family protein phosphatase [Bryobacteraceae bacterium]
MNAVARGLIYELRPKILERRARLEAATRTVSAEYVTSLLAEIDATLQRIEDGTFGLCESCHDPIEADRLARNPLLRFCLDHLTAEQMKAHEEDLELATQIQSNLLPEKHITISDWETRYRYEPAGVVGGDYCEIIPCCEGRSLFFALGDVTGKGVAASLLMTHLSAIFRSLLSLDLPLEDVIFRANRLFCDSTPATHYATLVAARTTAEGLDLCSAGHCRPLLLRHGGGAEWIDSTGLPLGLFCSGRYTIRRLRLNRGDSLVLYTDGVTEAQDPEGNLYGEPGLLRSLQGYTEPDATAMVDRVLEDVTRFRGAAPQQDDITLLMVRRRT